MRASHVNDSSHLRKRATEMRGSLKELKDDNTTALIMRLADLYDPLPDRAAAPGDSAAHPNAQSGSSIRDSMLGRPLDDGAFRAPCFHGVA